MSLYNTISDISGEIAQTIRYWKDHPRAVMPTLATMAGLVFGGTACSPGSKAPVQADPIAEPTSTYILPSSTPLMPQSPSETPFPDPTSTQYPTATAEPERCSIDEVLWNPLTGSAAGGEPNSAAYDSANDAYSINLSGSPGGIDILLSVKAAEACGISGDVSLLIAHPDGTYEEGTATFNPETGYLNSNIPQAWFMQDASVSIDAGNGYIKLVDIVGNEYVPPEFRVTSAFGGASAVIILQSSREMMGEPFYALIGEEGYACETGLYGLDPSWYIVCGVGSRSIGTSDIVDILLGTPNDGILDEFASSLNVTYRSSAQPTAVPTQPSNSGEGNTNPEPTEEPTEQLCWDGSVPIHGQCPPQN